MFLRVLERFLRESLVSSRTQALPLAMASTMSCLPSKRRASRIAGKGLHSEALVLENRAPFLKSKHDKVFMKVQATSLNPMCVYHRTPPSAFSYTFRGLVDGIPSFLPGAPAHALRKVTRPRFRLALPPLHLPRSCQVHNHRSL